MQWGKPERPKRTALAKGERKPPQKDLWLHTTDTQKGSDSRVASLLRAGWGPRRLVELFLRVLGLAGGKLGGVVFLHELKAQGENIG